MLDDLNSLLTGASFAVIVPTVVLLVLLLTAGVVLFRAQMRSDFDVANMLKDDQGKESALRLGIFVSLAISSWGIVFMIINKTLDPGIWTTYLMTWSGALIFVKLADKWNGQLPWAKAS